MVRNSRKLLAFEDRITRGEPRNLKKNFKLLDSLYREAVSLGAFPPRDPLEGLDIDIKISKVVRSVSSSD